MKTSKICVGQSYFEVEIAQSLLEKTRGLAGKKSLDENKGMLFVFSFESYYPFSMRNTLIPLDIIWLNKNYEIVHIAKNCKPCKIFFCTPIMSWKKAKYVLEINSGLCEKLGIGLSDKIKLSAS